MYLRILPLHTEFRLPLPASEEYEFREQIPGWARRFNPRLYIPPTHALRPVIPDNARTLCLTAAAGTELAGAYS